MPTVVRRHARTCSVRCRVALHRARRREAAEQIPAELRKRDRWVRRSPRKVPLRVDGRGAAASTDPSTWSSYEAAARSKVGVGLGFVLNGDGVVCLDLDHCIDERGQVAAWAQRILDACPPTFVEVSPSGRGLHIWGRGSLRGGRVIRDGEVRVEAYATGRYIAMGRRVEGAPLVLGDLDGVLSVL